MSVKFGNNNGELNGIINKVSSTNEFKDIIKNITSSLNDLDSNNDDNEQDYCFEEVLGMFLLDKDGNNLCDCINKLTDTLEKLINNKNK